jgi:uncharacterized protein involved in outer membrane biogenesis
MHKSLKILLPIVAVIVILLIIGYFLLTSFLTPTRMQTIAQKFATEALQRPVEIGRVGLRIGFGIGITISDISVLNTEDFRRGPMIEIERATLNLQLLPLLTRRIVINRIELRRMNANVEQNRKGQLNFAGLMPQQAQGTGWAVALSNIRIRESRVQYWNALTKAEYAVENIDQDIRFRGNDIAVSGKLKTILPEQQNIPELELTINNAVEYDTLKKDIDIRSLTIAAKSMQLKLTGSVANGEDLDLKAELAIRDLAKLQSLIPAGSRPEALDGSISGDFQIQGTLQKPTIDGQFALQNIAFVPKGMVRGIEKTSGKISFDQESIEEIDVKGNIGSTSFTITGVVSRVLTKQARFDINIDLTGDLKDLESMTKEMEQIDLQGVFASQLSVKGTTSKPEFSGDIRIDDAKIDKIGLGKPVSNMNLRARLQGSSLRITSCNGKIGRSDFAITAKISDFSKPVVRIENHSRYIDLDELMPQTEKPPARQGQAAPLTMNGSLKIDRLTGMDMEFKNINTTFEYENGVIDLKDCRAQTFDGDVYLDFYYDVNSPEPYRLSTRMQSVSSQKILQRFLNMDRIQGNLSGTANFKGRGLDEKSVMSNLEGAGNLRFTNGTFSNFPLFTKLLGWLGMKDYENVQFNDMQGAFTIKQGQARVDGWTVSSRVGDFLTEGTIGLDGKLNLDVAATLSKTSSNTVKKYHGDWLFYVDKDGRAVIDIVVTGKPHAPTFRLNSTKVKERLKGRLKNAFEQKKKDFEQKIKDWLKW